jgi:hypothetical protein
MAEPPLKRHVDEGEPISIPAKKKKRPTPIHTPTADSHRDAYQLFAAEVWEQYIFPHFVTQDVDFRPLYLASSFFYHLMPTCFTELPLCWTMETARDPAGKPFRFMHIRGRWRWKKLERVVCNGRTKLNTLETCWPSLLHVTFASDGFYYENLFQLPARLETLTIHGFGGPDFMLAANTVDTEPVRRLPAIHCLQIQRSHHHEVDTSSLFTWRGMTTADMWRELGTALNYLKPVVLYAFIPILLDTPAVTLRGNEFIYEYADSFFLSMRTQKVALDIPYDTGLMVMSAYRAHLLRDQWAWTLITEKDRQRCLCTLDKLVSEE